MIDGSLKGSVYSVTTMSSHDGPGMRTVVFLYGCHCQCKYCHNPESWMGKYQRRTVHEIVKECLRDQAYYGKNGGVTISGGEPLLQEKFTLALIYALKEHGIHVAVDTSGLVESREVYLAADMIIMDIKGVNQEQIDQCCVGQWQVMMKNVALIEEYKIPHYYRHVVIPGINDRSDLLERACLIGKGNVEFLPYHDMAKQKWGDLGLIYPLSDTPALSLDSLDSLIAGTKNEEDPRE